MNSKHTSKTDTKKYMHNYTKMYIQGRSLPRKKKKFSLNALQEGNDLLNYGTDIKHKIMHSLKIGKNRKVINVDKKYCPQ